MTDEERREMARSNYAAQMEMLGYQPDGNPIGNNVTPIEANMPHRVSEVICVKCGKRWVSVRPKSVWLKDLECPNCGAGYVIETGEQVR